MKSTLTGIFHKTQKNGKTVTKFIRKGYTLNTYKYPSTIIPFKSDMVRWGNLNHCGGWSMCDENGTGSQRNTILSKPS